MIHTRGSPHVSPSSKIADTVRPSVISTQVDTVGRAVLHGNEHPVVTLRTSVDNLSESSNFAHERRVHKGELAPIIRIVDGRTSAAWSDFEMGDLAIEEAGAARLPNAGNEDRHIE